MHKILQQIRDNAELTRLENDGFIRGDAKGKTMDNGDMPILMKEAELYKALQKQFRELETAYTTVAKGELRRRIADVRNNAGCLFLKIEEERAQK